MKKLLAYTVLAATPFSASAVNDKCTPNLTKQDMCIFAKKLSDEVQRELPVKGGDNLTLTEVKAYNTRVIITATMKYSNDSLQQVVGSNGKNIDITKASLRASAKGSVCSNKQLESFINLGGVIQNEYVFNDGKLFDIVAVTSCK